MLIDVNPLWPVKLTTPPMEEQLPNESRMYWKEVTDSILSKQFSRATTAKQEIEERQRQKAADRKARNSEWSPRFFTASTTPSGRPELTPDGKAAIDGLHKGQYHLEQAKETAA